MVRTSFQSGGLFMANLCFNRLSSLCGNDEKEQFHTFPGEARTVSNREHCASLRFRLHQPLATKKLFLKAPVASASRYKKLVRHAPIASASRYENCFSRAPGDREQPATANTVHQLNSDCVSLPLQKLFLKTSIASTSRYNPRRS